MNRFELHKQHASRAQVARNCCRFIESLPADKSWVIEVKRLAKKRSNEANAYLWGVIYVAFTQALEGWDAEDVHEYLLGECFGWERLEGLDRVKVKPIKRSSKLSTIEFAEYTEFCIRRGAEHGIYVPPPEPVK